MKTIQVCLDIQVPDDWEPRDGCTELHRWLEDAKQCQFTNWQETLVDLNKCPDSDTRRKGIYLAAIAIYKKTINEIKQAAQTVRLVS